ncbi:kinesin-like protein KIF25 [Saccoglossus kowalevskii]
MAYGQTGSGKTHTMLGPHYITGNMASYVPKEPCERDGTVPRAARELFKLIQEKPAGSHTVEVSVCEVYNNDIYDLLRPGSVKHDVITTNEGSRDVPSLTQKSVHSADEVVALVQYGMIHRCTDATLIHEHSSRSHLVVTLTVTSPIMETPTTPSTSRTGSPTDVFAVPQAPSQGTRENRRLLPNPLGSCSGSMKAMRSRSPSPSRNIEYMANNMPVVKTKLQLVDLAGSECVGMSGVTGAALRETQFINKSLCALADVLGALAEHRSHVPYRNSRLTHLLQDSIGGDSKLLVMLCVSPAQRYITESMQSLGFGSRARQVARGPIKKRPAMLAGIVPVEHSSGSTSPTFELRKPPPSPSPSWLCKSSSGGMSGESGLVSNTPDRRRAFHQRHNNHQRDRGLSASISDSTPPPSPRQSPKIQTDTGPLSPGKGKGGSSRPSMIPAYVSLDSVLSSSANKNRASPSMEQLYQSGRNSPRTRMPSHGADRR